MNESSSFKIKERSSEIGLEGYEDRKCGRWGQSLCWIMGCSSAKGYYRIL